MSEEDPLVNGVPLSTLRVVDLKEELDKLGLSKLGNKNVLQERLREYLLEASAEKKEEETASVDPVTPKKEKSASPTKSPSGENPLVAAYRAKQQAALESAKKDAQAARRESESEDNTTLSPKKAEESAVEAETKKDAEPQEESAVIDEAAKEKEVKEEESAEKESEEPAETQSKQEKVVEAESDEKDAESPSTPRPTPEESETSKEGSQEGDRDAEEKENGDKGPESADASPKPTAESGVADDKKQRESESNKDEDKEDEEVPSYTVTVPVKPEVPSAESGAEELELDYGETEETEGDEGKEEAETQGNDEQDEVMDVEELETRKRKLKIEAPAADEREEGGETKRKREVSPSRYPESEFVHIRGLVRPFTNGQLKGEICKEGGEIVDFWIDNIKSHCIVQMRSVEEAHNVRVNLHNISWPVSNPKKLSVQFSKKEDLDRFRSGVATAPGRLPDKPADPARTVSTEKEHRPTIGALPGRNGSLRITVEAAVRDNKKRDVEAKERSDRERERKVTEHDGKHAEKRDDRENGSRKRGRSETPPFSRGALEKKRDSVPEERDARRREGERDGRRLLADRDGRRREEAEPIVKTADALFQKTKTLPCIYFMPLTDEQAAARDAKRKSEVKRRRSRDASRDRARR